jgi:hypothetical protein
MRGTIALAIAVTIIAAGCGDNGTSSQTGTLTISLTDAPATALEQVNITFSDVSAHIDNEWIAVRGEPVTVDLLEWNNGKSLTLGTAEVPSGNYTQIRLMIDAAEVVSDGQTYQATVPSGAQTGLKLGPAFTVEQGSTYELVVDFDARRSVVATGPPGNPGRYQIKPTVRVVPKAITGAVSGVLSDTDHEPTAYAIIQDDTVTSTVPDTTTGIFILSYLPPDVYTVAIEDTTGRTATFGGVPVEAGGTFELGGIDLQAP